MHGKRLEWASREYGRQDHIKHAVLYGFGGSVPYPALSPSPPPRGHEPAGSPHHAGERRKRLFLELRRLRRDAGSHAGGGEPVAILTTTQPSTFGRLVILSRTRRGRLPTLARHEVQCSLVPA